MLLKAQHYDNYKGGGCRIYEDGKVVRKATAGGCGYDREGTALANYFMLKSDFLQAIKDYEVLNEKLPGGVTKYNGTYYFDGAIGKNTVLETINKLNYIIKYQFSNRSSTYYYVEKRSE